MIRLTALLPLVLVASAPFAAHAFEVDTLDGERTSIEAHLLPSGPTLVQLWTSDCAPCERDKPLLEKWHREHSPSGTAAVIGLALDAQSHRAEADAALLRTPTSYTTLVALEDVFHEQYATLVALTGKGAFRATPTYLLFMSDGAPPQVHVGQIDESMLENILYFR